MFVIFFRCKYPKKNMETRTHIFLTLFDHGFNKRQYRGKIDLS